MKKHLLFLLLIAFLESVNGQEIGLNYNYTTNSSRHFKTATGYDLVLSKTLKSENKLSLILSYIRNQKGYDNIQPDITSAYANPPFFIDKVTPDNTRFSFSASYGFKLLNRESVIMRLGPVFGMNYIKINEVVRRFAYQTIDESTFQDKENNYNKFGLGFLLEFEIRNVVFKNLGLIYSVNPMVLDNNDMAQSTSESLTNVLNFRFGLNYHFGKKQE